MRVIPITCRAAAVCAALLIASPCYLAGQRATQTISFRVEPINQISVQGSPVLTVRDAIPGGPLSSVTVDGSTWSVTTNSTGAKITANLDQDLPAGLTLSVSLGAPTGAASAGLQVLRTTPVDVVANVSRTAAADLPIRYRLDAAITSGVVVEGTRHIVFTITDGM
ncbi:MAG TPA: hypothetical protein VN706_00085 [Gemmatimonadaceae bacterium]|nr:hypothetical protein [Gemmatimonadaceae bacterium]